MFRSSSTAIALAATFLATTAYAADPALDTARIESITGLTGTYNQAENVFKVSKPRADIKPTVDRWTLPPFMGITSYASRHRDAKSLDVSELSAIDFSAGGADPDRKRGGIGVSGAPGGHADDSCARADIGSAFDLLEF